MSAFQSQELSSSFLKSEKVKKPIVAEAMPVTRSYNTKQGLKRSIEKVAEGLNELRRALDEPMAKAEKFEEVELGRGGSSRENQRAEKLSILNKLLRNTTDEHMPTEANGGAPVCYQPSVFSESLYRELTKKLSPSEETKFREEVLRLERKQADISSRLWDDVMGKKVRVIIVTASGRKFCVEGENWPKNYEEVFPQPVDLRNKSSEDLGQH